jgi:hypothetical protein
MASWHPPKLGFRPRSLKGHLAVSAPIRSANREQAETLRRANRAYSENEPQKHEDPP